MTTLYRASNQWATRPADERYASVEALHAACVEHRATAVEAPAVPYRDLRVAAQDDGLTLVGRKGIPATLTHWAFGQLAARAEAPAGYLRDLPPTLAAQNLNHGLAARTPDDKASILMHRNDGMVVRAFTSDRYERIWDADVTSRLLRLIERDPRWQPAPAAFDGSRGLYASDHDVFAFMVDDGRRIFETLPGGGLSRGFFVWNSEVGASSFGVCAFLYEYVCGNHRVWGAKGVTEIRVRHVGAANDRAFGELAVELRRYAAASAADDEAAIERARTFRLGDTKEAVLDRLFGLRLPATQGALRAAVDLAEARVDRYGDPRTVWAVAGAMTEHSQTLAHADARVALDRAAGKLTQIAF